MGLIHLDFLYHQKILHVHPLSTDVTTWIPCFLLTFAIRNTTILKMTLLNTIQTICLSLLLTSNILSQTSEWARQTGGNGDDESLYIAVDSNKNIYSVGYFKGIVDFDPGVNTFELISNGDADIFIQKLDENGNFIWAKSIGKQYEDYATSIILGPANDLYITGKYRGLVDFDPGIDTFELTSYGNFHSFLLKLNSNGDFVWAKSWGGWAQGNSLIVDTYKNIYVCGGFSNRTDFDPQISTGFAISPIGGEDIFIEKLDSNGNFLWVKTIGGNDDDRPLSMTIDSSNNLILTGFFSGTVDFNTHPNGTYDLTSVGDRDVFILKTDSAGNMIWAKRLGGRETIIPAATWNMGLTAKTSKNGDVYIGGYYSGSVDFDPGPNNYTLPTDGYHDLFILKLNALGDFIWAKRAGSSSYELVEDLALDDLGNIYAIGVFSETLDFNPGSTPITGTLDGQADCFIMKLDSMGNLECAKTLSATTYAWGNSIYVDQDRNIYCSGIFIGSVEFNPLNGSTTILNSASPDHGDQFILKLSACSDLDLNISEVSVSDISVYPNPSTSDFSIELGKTHNDVSILVTDITGKIVVKSQYHITSLISLKIDPPSGIYFLRIISDKKQSVIRLIKE